MIEKTRGYRKSCHSMFCKEWQLPVQDNLFLRQGLLYICFLSGQTGSLLFNRQPRE
jgi:hypothetical protein